MWMLILNISNRIDTGVIFIEKLKKGFAPYNNTYIEISASLFHFAFCARRSADWKRSVVLPEALPLYFNFCICSIRTPLSINLKVVPTKTIVSSKTFSETVCWIAGDWQWQPKKQEHIQTVTKL